uniref:RB1-inducible coiled-coil protein 1 n=1 Tax=Parascaris univalens TaxID=6257 RepID=A0A915A5G4_PARUN
MFYVFYVNQGYMQPLEVTAALGTVHKLQAAIEEATHVPLPEQVLLVSGGDGLQSDRPVAHYQGAGTDSNPVFLFCKLSKGESQDSATPQENAELNDMCTGLLEQLRSFENLTISGALIVRYTEASRLSRNIADRAMQLCARLVQDHQLLHQGWLALVSNLDDSRSQIEKRAERFYAHYERLKTMKGKAQTVLQEFDSVVDSLHKITIPSALLANSTKFEGGNKPNEECTLYDYISCADPQSSLKDVVDQVQVLLAKIDDSEHNRVVTLLKLVTEQTSKPEVRDIRGINLRLMQLDSHLRSLEQQERRLNEICAVVTQGVPHDPSHIKDVVFKQREQMEEVKKIMEQLQKTAKAFSQSKHELLNNIRTRLSGWILQAYERLHTVNSSIVIFEEKFLALRNRLDIIRQVKESPVMYVTAITEAIRRNALYPEFQSWFASFTDKSKELVREECSIREAFNSKLDRHFLKQLFPGMFDQFPDFAPGELPSFDQNLPPVDFAHLRALRQTLPQLAHLLKVSEPAVYQRLAVRDPRAASVIHSGGVPAIRREESFFTSDATINVATLNKNFPSTNWLSGDENMDMSPSNALLLTKSPPRFSSTLSLDNTDASSKPLNPLAPLFDTPHQECDTAAASTAVISQSVKSAPIRIPHRADSSRQMSEKSSQFSTPEDHFASCQYRQFDMDRRSNQMTFTDAMEHLKPILCGLHSVLSEMNETKEVISAHKGNVEEDIKAALNCAERIIDECDRLRRESTRKEVEEARNHVKKECVAHYESIVDKLKTELEEGTKRDRELEDLKEVLEEQQAEINALRMYKESTENAIAKLESEKAELFKTFTIEHEVDMEKMASLHSDEMKRKEKEINSLKAALHKARETRTHAQASETEDSASRNEEIRATFEKEYKSRMQFLVKGLEEKKADEIARIKKEAEFDLRMKSKEYEEKIRELERLLQREESAICQALDREEREITDDVPEETCSSLNNPNAKLLLQESIIPLTESAIGAMGASRSRDTSESGDAKGAANRTDEKSDDEEKDSEEDIAAVSVNSATTQTRIRLKDMRVMITIQDIHEACAVLVVWSEPHNSYILFCTSPVMHFVKESCLRRMGVRPDAQMSSRRPNWLLATTTRLEFCQIRKADNRYNLTIGTRFYRVEVEPLPLDSSSMRRRRSDD